MDWVSIILLAVIVLFCLRSLWLGVRAVQSGEVIYHSRLRYSRTDQSVKFWWVTGRRLIGPFVIFGIIIFVLNNLGAAWP